MGLVEMEVDGEDYRVLPIMSFVVNNSGGLVELIETELIRGGFRGVWEDGYLLRVEEFHELARESFQSEKIGVLYFVNCSEPDVPMDQYDVMEGDVVDLVYLGEWESGG